MSKLPKLIIKPTDNYRLAGAYLMSIPDKEHHQTHRFRGDDGKEFVLYTADDSYINDERLKHPTIGRVEASFGDTCFDKGDLVIVEHNTFRHNVEDFKVFYTTQDGVDLYRVMNYDVIARINDDGTLTPRDYRILCNPVKEKLYETSLELPEELVDNRRDLVEIAIVGGRCGGELLPGKFALIAKDADYEVNHSGRKYLSVDVSQDFEVLAVTDDSKWRKSEVYKHHKRQ